jgi:uncharacterized protein (DUF362 family)
MALDLNKILFYGNSEGSLRSLANRRRKYFCLVDAIIAGEGNGPLSPTPVPLGVLIAGCDPVAVECVGAKLMGFNWRNISLIRESFNIEQLPISNLAYDDIQVVSNDKAFTGLLKEVEFTGVRQLEPHFGWKGHIEAAL